MLILKYKYVLQKETANFFQHCLTFALDTRKRKTRLSIRIIMVYVYIKNLSVCFKFFDCKIFQETYRLLQGLTPSTPIPIGQTFLPSVINMYNVS